MILMLCLLMVDLSGPTFLFDIVSRTRHLYRDLLRGLLKVKDRFNIGKLPAYFLPPVPVKPYVGQWSNPAPRPPKNAPPPPAAAIKPIVLVKIPPYLKA